MDFTANNIYHVYNQGNNKQKLFFEKTDYLIFLSLYKKLVTTFAETLAWCLMPNHFHFMLYIDERWVTKKKLGSIFIDPISDGFRRLSSGYARIFNKRNNRSGSMFRQKTKTKRLSDIQVGPSSALSPYIMNCFHYIHQNPLVAKLVARMEDWDFSSFKDYACLRTGSICNKSLASLYCKYDPNTFLQDSYKLVDEKAAIMLT